MRMRTTTAALLCLLAFRLLGIVSAQQVCNGYAEFCNRSYGNVTFMGAHDSAFYSTLPVVISADQHYDVTRQLNDGIRLLQSQGHHPLTNTTGNIELCHTSCELYDGGSLVAYLTKVKAWLDKNPNEVLMILFTNPDGINVTTWAYDFNTTGIADMAYVPPFTSTPNDTFDWPTLGSMISSGKRVVIFLDAGANQDEVDFILNEFTYMWETPFDQTNQSFPCNVDRPGSLVGQTPTGRLAVINHFLDSQFPDDILVPDRPELNVTNGVSGFGSLGLMAQQCAALWGRYPNFFLNDFYDVGNGSVFEVAAQCNGVPYKPTADFGSEATHATRMAILPVYLIIQFIFSSLAIAGAWSSTSVF